MSSLTHRCPVGILHGVSNRNRTPSKTKLKAQAQELLELRGERTQAEWIEVLGVGKRTYIRYEQGQRMAPEPLMRLARLSGESAKKRA
jgi:hypothetical protein